MGRPLAARALTLLEILLTMAVFSVAVLAMLSVFVHGLRLTGKAQDVVVATEVARELLEVLREQDSALPSGVATFDGRKPDPAPSFLPAPYPKTRVNDRDYHLVVTVLPVEGELRCVKVEVYWDESSKVAMATYYRP